MIHFLNRLFFHQWHRKLTALVAAIIIWALVNHSITITRTIPNIPVRVLNIPENMTIEGLQPNGFLSRRLTLTVTGRKTAIQDLMPGDIQVVTDAVGKGDRWTLEVTRKNLVATDPELDLSQVISSVVPLELTIQLAPFITQQVPVKVIYPIGEPPQGYTFLDVWPQRLYQTVSGPKEKVEELQEKGLRLVLDLSKVSKSELDTLNEKSKALGEDEIRYFVPEGWKRVVIPFETGKSVELNDPEATYLHLDFLKQEEIPLEQELPVSVFYPIVTSGSLNPTNYPLDTDGPIKQKNGLYVLAEPLYARNVSRLFLDTVIHNTEITILAITMDKSQSLPWSIEFIDPTRLEEAYLAAALETLPGDERQKLPTKWQEEYLRSRFRNYMRQFQLLREDKSKFQLKPQLEHDSISIKGN